MRSDLARAFADILYVDACVSELGKWRLKVKDDINLKQFRVRKIECFPIAYHFLI